ncbi:MAG: hypothetical protein OEV42_20290, partial [Deltaproteobacteria bacterium]|nr:hypothetical protein [Deltaproteobacteria bacterium]
PTIDQVIDPDLDTGTAVDLPDKTTKYLIANNDVPDYIEKLGIYAEYSLSKLLGYGFKPPLNIGKSDVKVMNTSDIGFTSYFSAIYISNKQPDILDVIIAHELFHRMQLAYSLRWESWVKEGTAAWIEDLIFDNSNRYVKTFNFSDSDSFNDPQIGYFNDPDQSLLKMSENAVLFWKYISEQYTNYRGINDEPYVGVDVIKSLWENFSLVTSGREAVQKVLDVYAPGVTFEDAFTNWIIANYVKRYYEGNPISDTGYAAIYDYIEDDEANYGVIKTINFNVTNAQREDLTVASYFYSNQSVNEWAADYWEFNLDNTIDKVVVSIEGSGSGKIGAKIGYNPLYVILKMDQYGKLAEVVEDRGSDYFNDYKVTFPNNNYSRIVVIVAGLEDGGTYDIAVGGAVGLVDSLPVEPTPDPTSLSLSADFNPSDNIVANSLVTVSGSVIYDNGVSVDVGSITINTGENIYTAPVLNGKYSRDINAPSSSQMISVMVKDDLFGFSKTIDKAINILEGQSSDGYVIDRTTTSLSVDLSLPHNPLFESKIFSISSEKVYVWLQLSNVYKAIAIRYKFFDPDGLGVKTYTHGITDPQNKGLEFYDIKHSWASMDIKDNLASEKPGRWICKISIDSGNGFEYKKTETFVIGYELTEHRMGKGVEQNKPYSILNETYTFFQTDTSAFSWGNVDNMIDAIDVRWDFYEPNGSLFESVSHVAKDFYNGDSYSFWGDIPIQGHPASNKTGDWHVDVLIKGSNGSYQKIYMDHFKILELPSSTPEVSTSIAIKSVEALLETNNVVISINALDNTYLKRIELYWDDGTRHSHVIDNIYLNNKKVSIDIGQFSSNKQVQYWVKVFDTSGNFIESPRKVIGQTVPAAPIIISVE